MFIFNCVIRIWEFSISFNISNKLKLVNTFLLQRICHQIDNDLSWVSMRLKQDKINPLDI